MSSSLARSTLLMVAAFGIAAVCDYAFGAGMSWLLPAEEYGTLSVAMSYFLLLSFFVASGFPMSLAKVLSERPDTPRGLIRYALLANLVVAIAVVSLFLGLTFYGPLSPGPGYGRLVVGVALSVLLLSVGTTLHYALQGRMAFGAFALLHASKSVNKLVFGALLVLAGFGLAGAVGGLVVGSLFLVAAAGWLLRAQARDGAPLDPEERRRFLSYTWAVFAGSLALTLLMSLDLLAVKYLTPAGESNRLAAYYQSASILTKAPLWAVIAGLSVLFPLLSREAARDEAAAQRMLGRVLRWTMLALAPFVAILIVFPRHVLAILFPAEYAPAAPALAVSAVGMAALAIAFVLTRALQATGRARAPGAYLAVGAGLQVVLLFALVPRWGIVGAALATTLACSAGALLSLAQSMTAFGLRARWDQAVSLAMSLGILVGIVVALDPARPLSVLGAFALGGLCYLAAAVLTGLVTREERLALGRLLARLVGRKAHDDVPGAPEA